MSKRRGRPPSVNGMSNTTIYRKWKQMVYRCTKTFHARYKDYGGRGITVCEEWMDFNNFFRDMGYPPEGKSLDRIDNDKGYYLGNCRWATRREQGGNCRSNVKITFGGITHCLEEWARKMNIDSRTLLYRYNIRVSAHDLFKPTGKGYTDWNKVRRERKRAVTA